MPVLDPIAYYSANVKHRRSLDGEGAEWTEEVSVAAADKGAAGVFLGNAYGCLFAYDKKIWWITTEDPDDWSGETPADTGLAEGRVYGIARSRRGILCALVDNYVVRSFDHGATWLAGSPITTDFAGDRNILAVGEKFYVFFRFGNTLVYFMSPDHGATWL